MRRILLAFIVGLIGAFWYGHAGTSSGLSVNNQQVSAHELRSELNAMSSHPVLQCYLEALDPALNGAGAGSFSVTTNEAAAWSNFRVEGIAISQYVEGRMGFTPSKSQLEQAKLALEGEMTQAAAQAQLSCPGTSAQAVAAMTPQMKSSQLLGQATSMFLVSRLNATLPLTTASLQSYYQAHKSSYDTLCVAVAVVAPTSIAAFTKAAAAGISVSNLAKKFSLDASGAKGGAYGCYPPTSGNYTGIRSDVGTTPDGHFTTTPQAVSYGGQTVALYVAVTKRTVTPFISAQPAVLSDVETYNSSSANTVKSEILYQAAIAVDPAFGRWGLSSSGPAVFAPAAPAKNNVTGATQLLTAVAQH